MARFSKGDKVQLSKVYHAGRPLAKGLEYGKVYTITRSNDFSYPDRVAIDGNDNSGIGWYAERFEKVDASPKYKVGDKLRWKGTMYSKAVRETPFVVHEVDDKAYKQYKQYALVNAALDKEMGRDNFKQYYVFASADGHSSLFEVWPEKVEVQPVNNEVNMESTGAMSPQIARQLRQRILDETGAHPDTVVLVGRTWDKELRFAAINIYAVAPESPTVKPQEHLVHPKQVATFLDSLTPIDITPYRESTRLGVKVYSFRSPITNLIFRMNGTEWFTEADIKNGGGTLIHDGKRYRPGITKFVPFLDTAK